MPQNQMPDSYPDWCDDSAADQLAKPSSDLQKSGFTPGQRPAAPIVNGLFHRLGRWVRYLAQSINAVVVGSNVEPAYRLTGGGAWSLDVAGKKLSWSAPFQIACPGLAAEANQVGPGSVTLAPGQLAYVQSNAPFGTTGNLESGSATVNDLAFQSGIAPEMSVTGPQIAPGATVLAIADDGQSLTLSQPALGDVSKANLVFASQGALAVQVAAGQDLAMAANTVVFAVCVARDKGTPAVFVGVNSGQMRLLAGETKGLLGTGYTLTTRAVAGAPIAARQPVYFSSGASDGRTAGQIYPLDVSAASTPARAAFAGFAADAAEAGQGVNVVQQGLLAGFAGMVPGTTYYASPSSPATLQATRPLAAKQFVVPVGSAIAPDTLCITPATQAQLVPIGGETRFDGPIVAPSVVSAKGFKCIVDMGQISRESLSFSDGAIGTTKLNYSVSGTGSGRNTPYLWCAPFSGSIVAIGYTSHRMANAGLRLDEVYGGNEANTIKLQLALATSGIGSTFFTPTTTFPRGQYRITADQLYQLYVQIDGTNVPVYFNTWIAVEFDA